MLQEPKIGLRRKEIRKQNMTQLMCEQCHHNDVAFLAATMLLDHLMSAVDPDGEVVRTGHIRVLGIPVQVNMDPAVVLVTPGLCGRNILKVAGQDPRGKELPVRDLAPLFIEELPHLLMLYPCHLSTSPCQDAFLRLGAKIGSSTVVFSASRSSSSEEALLMMVLMADL